MGDLAGEPGRGTREPATSPPAGAAYEPLAEPTVRRARPPRGGVGAEEEACLEESVRRGARRAMDEKEQEESGGSGLYGSQIDASHIIGAAIAELVSALSFWCMAEQPWPSARSLLARQPVRHMIP